MIQVYTTHTPDELLERHLTARFSRDWGFVDDADEADYIASRIYNTTGLFGWSLAGRGESYNILPPVTQPKTVKRTKGF